MRDVDYVGFVGGYRRDYPRTVFTPRADPLISNGVIRVGGAPDCPDCGSVSVTDHAGVEDEIADFKGPGHFLGAVEYLGFCGFV